MKCHLGSEVFKYQQNTTLIKAKSGLGFFDFQLREGNQFMKKITYLK